MKLKSLIVCVVCALPLVAFGAPSSRPTSRPGDDPRPERGPGRAGPGFGRIDDAQWAAAEKFFTTDCKVPNLLKEADSAADRRERRVRTLLFMQYRNFDWLQKQQHDDELYKNGIDQLQSLDQVVGTLSQLKTASPAAAESLRAQLKDGMLKLNQIKIVERRLRLDRLKKLVEAEEARLAKDQADLADPEQRALLLEEQAKRLINSDAPIWALVDMLRKPGDEPKDGPPKHGPPPPPPHDQPAP